MNARVRKLADLTVISAGIAKLAPKDERRLVHPRVEDLRGRQDRL
jgi:hypothetical protein